MKKIGVILVFLVIVFVLFACQGSTTTSQETMYPTFPVLDYSSYSLDYLVIRNKDESGRTISLDYYYDNLEQVSTQVSSILSELPNVCYNGGIGPLTGRYNDGWVTLKGQDNSSLTLIFYLFDDYTILGLMVDQYSTEFFYQGFFDTEMLAIFASIST